jgi:hypothetical protein
LLRRVYEHRVAHTTRPHLLMFPLPLCIHSFGREVDTSNPASSRPPSTLPTPDVPARLRVEVSLLYTIALVSLFDGTLPRSGSFYSRYSGTLRIDFISANSLYLTSFQLVLYLSSFALTLTVLERLPSHLTRRPLLVLVIHTFRLDLSTALTLATSNNLFVTAALDNPLDVAVTKHIVRYLP